MTTGVKQFPLTTRLATPGAPTVTPQGTPGVETWEYLIVAVNADGQRTDDGAVGATATGAATLNGTDFNRLTWSAVPNAVSYDVYRVTSGGTPATTGKIATAVAALTLDDTGLVGDASTAPATNGTGVALKSIDTLHMRNKSVQAGTGTYTVQLEGTIDGSTWENAGAAIAGGASADVARTYALMRANVTAYTSGTPKVSLAGQGPGG